MMVPMLPSKQPLRWVVTAAPSPRGRGPPLAAAAPQPRPWTVAAAAGGGPMAEGGTCCCHDSVGEHSLTVLNGFQSKCWLEIPVQAQYPTPPATAFSIVQTLRHTKSAHLATVCGRHGRSTGSVQRRGWRVPHFQGAAAAVGPCIVAFCCCTQAVGPADPQGAGAQNRRERGRLAPQADVALAMEAFAMN